MSISTHTSRVGCDNLVTKSISLALNFYSHIPCGMWLCSSVSVMLFKNFYSHIPCGMWRSCHTGKAQKLEISTHTSRVGCDVYHESNRSDFTCISTHTSRVGCDLEGWARDGCTDNFYSHIPCGMWLKSLCWATDFTYFYSHIPCGMWPFIGIGLLLHLLFLLTHPVWDVTWKSAESTTAQSWFLLTHPVWDVTVLASHRMLFLPISTHTSRVGCDLYEQRCVFNLWISTHTSRVGCDYSYASEPESEFNFYSHIPCGMWQRRYW